METSTERALNCSGESPRKSVLKYRKIKQTKSIVSIKSMKSKNYTFKEILILYIYMYSSVVHKRMTVVSKESTWANKLSCELISHFTHEAPFFTLLHAAPLICFKLINALQAMVIKTWALFGRNFVQTKK